MVILPLTLGGKEEIVAVKGIRLAAADCTMAAFETEIISRQNKQNFHGAVEPEKQRSQ